MNKNVDSSIHVANWKTWYGSVVWYVLWYRGMVRIATYHDMNGTMEP